jgi:hypothetical protein
MPATHAVDPQRRLIIVTATGRLTGSDLFAVDGAMRSDPAACPDYHQILDYSRITEDCVTAAELRQLSDPPPFFRPTSRRAIVASGLLAYGNMRMFELLRNGAAGTFRFFQNYADAERWVLHDEDRLIDAAP